MDNRPPARQVAIPKLGRHDHDRKAPRKRYSKPHVRKACNNCHKRKVRCSGEQPHCRNCADQHVPCVYPQARRDRLQEATDHKNQLIAFLKSLTVRVDDGEKQKIDEFLDSLSDDGSAPAPPMARKTFENLSREGSVSDEESKGGPNRGETDVSGSVGSDDGPDLLDENLFRSSSSRATGFIGQNSEAQWLRSLKIQMYADALHAQRKSSELTSILYGSDSTFYLDDDDLDVDIMVDPYELPPPETAERLFDCYMQTVHYSFPILPKAFEEQFRKYNNSIKLKRPFHVPKGWQAMLNLVLAIGAQYSHLIQAEWRADERDRLIYMMRAIRILRLDEIATSLHAPSLSIIRATGLLSLYYLTVGHVSRAWVMIGISLRFAVAVGLHLENDDPSALPSEKESLVRTWWSLHSIESLLSTLIGRPCMIPNDNCTVPLPQVLPEEQPCNSIPPQWRNLVGTRSKSTALSDTSSPGTASSGDPETVKRVSVLQARTQISIFMQKALSKLYLPRISIESWERIQKEIASLTRELDEWAVAALPEGLGQANSIHDSGVQRERLLLSFQYHSAKLLICRPCLCRLERRIKSQSYASRNFNIKMAEACVQAAQALTSLFPEQPDWMFIYQRSPWWCIVHYIMQAITVFLLEMSFSGTGTTHTGGELSNSIDKLVRWLRFMSVSNAIAERAYKMVMAIIESGALQVRNDISDVLVEEQAGIDRGHSFPPYSTSSDTAFPSQPENPFPQGERKIPLFHYPTATTNVDIQFPTTLWEQQPAHAFDEFQPNQYFMLNPSLQMPPVFGNPYLTNYDRPIPPTSPFYPYIDATTDDAATMDPYSA